MAADWIKMRTDLYRDPKVCLIADALMNPDGELSRYVNQHCQRYMTVTRNVTRNVTVGALVAVWGVARQSGRRERDDLVIRGATVSIVDDICEIPGFGDAMESVGWVRQSTEGVVFPNFFAEMNVDPVSKNAERQRRYRDRKGASASVTSNVTRDVTRNVTRNDRDRDRDREEKSIKGKDPHPPKTEPDPISEIESEFIAAWNAAKGVVACRGDSLTPKRRQAIKSRLKDAAWDWRAALAKFPLKLVASDPNGWKPDVDWFLRPDSVTRILEGKYDWAKSDKKTGASLFGPGQTYDPGAAERDSDHGKL